MTHAPFPIYNVDAKPAVIAFSNVGPAIDGHNYDRAIDFCSVAIQEIQRSLLVTALDHRAFALGMKGQFDAAVQDAMKVTTLEPTLATGYYRLSSLYIMQGKQIRAIEAYEHGLRCVSQSDPVYPLLLYGKQEAARQNLKRVDFVANLPSELANSILTEIPKPSIAACLSVSRIWRDRLLKCRRAWCSMTITDKDLQFAGFLSHFAIHVEDLTLNITSQQVWYRYVRSMRQGSFKRLNSLHLTKGTTTCIDSGTIIPMKAALYHMGTTLTRLTLHFGTTLIKVTLSDVLSGLKNLKTLVYSTTTVFADIVGTFPLSAPHHALMDMDLKAESIAGEDITPFLQECPELCRLVLNGCNGNVLDVVDTSCPKLQILGYNSGSKIPGLDPSTGLWKFQATSLRHGEPLAILSFIRRNMNTLRSVYLKVSSRGLEDLGNNAFHDLTLQNLERLTFWGEHTGIIQSLLIRSLSSCTTLSHLTVVKSHNLPSLIEPLLALPRLVYLNLSHITAAAGGGGCLLRLFNAYATDSTSGQPFESIRLRYCDAVTDEVLDALSNITTLKEITLEYLQNVSSRGIDAFFQKLGNTTDIDLIRMGSITDRQLFVLSNVKGLERIRLESLSNVSDHGVLAMVEKAPLLHSLILIGRLSISPQAIARVKWLLKDRPNKIVTRLGNL
ncbi:hypothetical protein BJV82DRAFT_612435 [Fennellomyces sp. T-0311]|nr:hypothetical protein BJV82DRAFT_612435 [Fennellomyces sp. T-0311]